MGVDVVVEVVEVLGIVVYGLGVCFEVFGEFDDVLFVVGLE